MLRRHCSDEQLVALLDGELSGNEQAQVEEHLTTCWRCRARRADIEQGIHRLSHAVDDLHYPGPEWPEQARARLRAGIVTMPPDSSVHFRRIPAQSWRERFYLPTLVAASVIVCVLLYANWSEQALLQEAHRRIDHFVESERRLGTAPLHQVVRVAFRRVGDRSHERNLRIEVWNDPVADRQAMRWRQSGELVHAAWRSGNQEWGLSPELPSAYPKMETLPEVLQAQWTPEDAEMELLAWMGSRAWKPIALSNDLRKFSEAPDAKIETSPLSNDMVRLRTTRERPDVTTQWTVEINDVTHRPNRQTIRWHRNDETMEIELVTEQEEMVASLSIPPEIFENPLSVETSVLPPDPPFVTETPLPALPPPSDLVVAAIRAEYCLQHLPHDWVSALQVVEGEHFVVVRGVTETAPTRMALEEELESIDGVRTELQSVEEAEPATAAPAEVIAEAPLPEPVFPLEEELAAYFVSISPDREKAARLLAQFSREAVLLSATIRNEAWMLRQLRERFPDDRMALAPVTAVTQLRDMRQQHQENLMRSASQLWALLHPVLHPLSESSDPVLTAEEQIPEPSTELSPDLAQAAQTRTSTAEHTTDPPLPQLAEQVTLDAAEAIDRRVRAILAGGSQLDSSAGVTVQRLLRALEGLPHGLQEDTAPETALHSEIPDHGAPPQEP